MPEASNPSTSRDESQPMDLQEEQQPAAADSTSSSSSSSSSFTLHQAARNGLVAEVAAMIAAGASTEVYDEQGATPLLWAAQQGHHEVRHLLVLLFTSWLHWWLCERARIHRAAAAVRHILSCIEAQFTCMKDCAATHAVLEYQFTLAVLAA
jgi:hypothetical protein